MINGYWNAKYWVTNYWSNYWPIAGEVEKVIITGIDLISGNFYVIRGRIKIT